jgi:hypothetical protein
MPVSKPKPLPTRGNMPPQTKDGTRRHDKVAYGNNQSMRRYRDRYRNPTTPS